MLSEKTKTVMVRSWLTIIVLMLSFFVLLIGNNMYGIKELLRSTTGASSCARFNLHLGLSVVFALLLTYYIIRKIWKTKILSSALLTLFILAVEFKSIYLSINEGSQSSFGYHTSGCYGNIHLFSTLLALYACIQYWLLFYDPTRAKLVSWRKKHTG